MTDLVPLSAEADPLARLLTAYPRRPHLLRENDPVTTPARRIRAKVSRAVCAVARHRPVRTITGVTLGEVSAFGDVRGTITGSRIDCLRCGKRLERTL